MTSSSALGDISKMSPIRLGIPLKYQICVTGAANSICAIRSRRTLDFVISTPQRSQTTPLRSEEHTSELQSRGHLVCRLLLDKNKHNGIHVFQDKITTPV